MKISAKVFWFLGALALAGAPSCKEAPKPADIHREAGDEFLRNNDYQKAAEEYGKSLEADPKQEKLYENKAFCHMNAGDMDAAEATILKTLDFKADNVAKAAVYYNLAGIYMSKNMMDKAEKNFEKSSELNPKDDQSLSWLGEIWSQRGGARDMKAAPKPEALLKALEYYDKAIAAKPEIPAAYVNKRIAMGKLMESERLAKEAADKEVTEAGKDKDKAAAATAESEKHAAKYEDWKKKLEELGKKIGEVLKNAPKAEPAKAPGK